MSGMSEEGSGFLFVLLLALALFGFGLTCGAIIFPSSGYGYPREVKKSTIYKVVEDSTLVVLEDQSGKRLLYDLKGKGKTPKAFKVEGDGKITPFP